MKYRDKLRLNLISVLLILTGLVITSRLYYLQVINGSEYRERANGQYINLTDSIFDRGTIFFQTKDKKLVAGATIKTGYFLFINPKLITNASELFSSLATIIPSLDQESFLSKASKKDDSYEEIVHRLDEDTLVKIQDLEFKGLGLHKENWRFYPGNNSASAVLGLMGYKENDYAGRYGLESFYDGTLKRDQSDLYKNFFAQIFNTVAKSIKTGELEGNLVTSIEPTVENEVESELQKIITEWHPKEVGAIVIDPTNGEIISMGVLPNFNPNSPQDEKNSNIFSNPLVESAYEMGSIIKPLTMVAGLDARVVTATTTYFDAGTVTLNGKKISNFDGKGRGTVSMQEVLSQSLNTGATFVMQKIGRDKFSAYFRQFGIGQKTGIDLPNETPGLAGNLSSNRDIEHATASFGQGIAISPIATARALSVLANGGFLVTPHVVKSKNYRTGINSDIEVPAPRQVLSKYATDEITRMLVNVVDKALLNGQVKMEHYSVAAKTGTAQIANPNGGGYYNDRYLHSFFGYFPAYNPKFLVFLYAKEPVGAQYASATLTKPFMNIVKFLIGYYEIPPDR